MERYTGQSPENPSLERTSSLLARTEFRTKCRHTGGPYRVARFFCQTHPDVARSLLPERTSQLVAEGRIGAAAALEVCARLQLAESLPAFEAALADACVPSLVREVAAQRARMLRIQDVQRRAALGELVRKNILGWIEDNSTKAARDAFLTVALEGPASLSWLKAIVGDSQDAEILEASAHAACTVVTQSGQNEISARFVEGTDARGFRNGSTTSGKE